MNMRPLKNSIKFITRFILRKESPWNQRAAFLGRQRLDKEGK